MHKLILAAALILAAIIPAKAQQSSFEVEALISAAKAGIFAADIERANRAAGRKLRFDEHVSRWFPLERGTEDFDRLRMQRAGEVIR